MKKSIGSFLAGSLTTILVGTLVIPSIAATITSRATIEVDTINIQVNGEVFVPHDATGAEVPVFAYQGTTYAPLRALAEAYGLKVGYDAESNMATVGTTAASAPSNDDPHEIKNLNVDQIDPMPVYFNGEKITSETEPVFIIVIGKPFFNFEVLSSLTDQTKFDETLFPEYYTMNEMHYVYITNQFDLDIEYNMAEGALYLTTRN